MSKRLETILSVIPRCSTLCDVGCDHGYVGVGALQRGVADKVTFVDISADCLQKARENCPAGVEGKTTFVCQDGIGEIPCDCAVIAGMGGLEIISILSNAKALPQTLVLQPMRNQYDVRKYICAKYYVTQDFKFYDGKYYDLIVAKLSGKPQTLTETELYFGKDNLSKTNDDFTNFLNNERTKLTKILQGCDDIEVTKRLAMVDAALARIKEITQ